MGIVNTPSSTGSIVWSSPSGGAGGTSGSITLPATQPYVGSVPQGASVSTTNLPSCGQWGNNIGNEMHVEGDVNINGNLKISGKIYIKDEYGNILVCSDIKRERCLMIAMIKWSRENQGKDPNECFDDPQFCFWVEKAGKYIEKLSKVKTVQDYDEETLILEAMFDLPKEIVKLLH